MRVWFNRGFSSIADAIELIRQADPAGRFWIVHSSVDRYSRAARAAHEFMQEPGRLEPRQYLDWCLEFCRRHGIGVFIPGSEATMIAAEHARFESAGTRVLSVASAEQLGFIHDKARFYAESCLPDAPVPPSRAFSDLAGFEAGYAALRTQHDVLCVKPAHSINGLGFAVVDEQRSCAALLLEGTQHRIGYADLTRGLAELGTFRTMLLMKYLDGDEYSIDCVGDAGRLVCAVPRRKPSRPGAVQRIDMRADLIAATAGLAQQHGLSGVFNVQFRESSGRPYLLEINPRMSGGMGMACAAGPNLPYIALCGFVDGYGAVEVPAIQDGMRVSPHLTGVERV